MEAHGDCAFSLLPSACDYVAARDTQMWIHVFCGYTPLSCSSAPKNYRKALREMRDLKECSVFS